MKSRHRLGGRLLLSLAAAIAATPFASWMLSAFGAGCLSLLSDEGWRWMARNFPEAAAGHGFFAFCSALLAAGAADGCGILRDGPRRHPAAFALSTATACAGALLLAAAAIHPASPLLGVAGGLAHSVYLYGLPHALSLCVLLASLVYGAVSGNAATSAALAGLMTRGLSRHAGAVVIYLLAAYLLECWSYVLQNGNM